MTKTSRPENTDTLLLLCLTVLTLITGFLLLTFSSDSVFLRRYLHFDSRLAGVFFTSVIPGFEQVVTESDPDLVLEQRKLDLLLHFLVGIRHPSPQELLRVQLPVTTFYQQKKSLVPVSGAGVSRLQPPAGVRKVPERPVPAIPSPAPAPPQEIEKPTTGPRVLIFHTHTSESYLPVSGKTHQFNGKGDIVLVGKHLAETLETKYRIPVLHCDTIHDHYPFRDSYQRSLATVEEYLKRHPELEIIIDVHRDATPGLEHRAMIRNRPAAKIILVVGTDRLGLLHPNWEKNHQFAVELVDAINRVYPDLAHRVILADARYNQHLHEKAILVEIGSEKSTLEEALYSAELFAEILASHLDPAATLQSFSL
ncbi:MAG: stage II sporulation protein P [Firmicutes bacterium]|nr:stage II sporulation protein P [Bacillota bacterium]